MPRFFFHSRSAEVFRDMEGTELPDEPAARKEAVRLLGLLVADDPDEFWAASRWSVEVRDQSGGLIATLDFLGHVPIH